MSFFAALQDWWHAPFEKKDALHVFLLVGLVMASLVLWGIILTHLRSVQIT